MAEYIEREAAVESFMGESPDAHYPSWYAEKLKELPTADVAKVRHGYWIVIDDDYEWDEEMGDEFYYVIECECSECKNRTRANRPQYCQHCGAKMNGRGDSDGE